ncbi:MAG: hypothetical protein QW350_04880 [Candidatus Aenigmatarchaeota archaeon]
MIGKIIKNPNNRSMLKKNQNQKKYAKSLLLDKDNIFSLIIDLSKKDKKNKQQEENKMVRTFSYIMYEKYKNYLYSMSYKYLPQLKEIDPYITHEDAFLMATEFFYKAIDFYLRNERHKEDLKNQKFSFYMILKNFVNGNFSNYIKTHSKKINIESFANLGDNEYEMINKML